MNVFSYVFSLIQNVDSCKIFKNFKTLTCSKNVLKCYNLFTKKTFFKKLYRVTNILDILILIVISMRLINLSI